MPSLEIISDERSSSNIVGGNDIARPQVNRLTYSGNLEKYSYNDLTPVIGREFEGLQVTDLLQADDDTIKDLAVTVSQRGVVFLRDQDVTPIQMKDLMLRLTKLAGCVRLPIPIPTRCHRSLRTNTRASLNHQVCMFTPLLKKEVSSVTRSASSAPRSRRREEV